MRSKLLIASIFGAILAGNGIAVAQIVDDPPGSAFQTQMIREADGLRGVPSPYIRAARAAQTARQARAYVYAPPQAYAYIHVPSVRHHRVVRHHR